MSTRQRLRRNHRLMGAIGVLVCTPIVTGVPAPATAAAKIHPSVQSDAFTRDDAARRLQRFLELVDDSSAPKLIGKKRWQELVASHHPDILAAASHEEFARRINALIEAGGVSHFHYFPDSSWHYWHMCSCFGDPEKFRVAHVGVFPQRFDGRWFARGIFEGSPADRAGFLVGDELVLVDGEPYRPIQSFEGKGGSSVVVRVQRRPGEFVDLTVTPVVEPLYEAMERAIIKSIDRLEHDGFRFAYVHGWTLLGKTPEHRRLLELEAEVDGLLVDYRDGFGGHWGSARRFLVGNKSSQPPADTWRKPVVILTADGTRSAKEIVVHTVRRRARAPLVGLPTPGHVISVGGVRRIAEDAIVMLPGKRFRLEGRPTMPDFLVARSIPYAAGEDVQLEAAKAVLAAWVRGDAATRLGASVHEVVGPAR